MLKFEYKTVEIIGSCSLTQIKLYTDNMNNIFNELGAEGWELVTSVPANYGGMMSYKVYYTFKRAI
jgi:hypothetical protein